MEPPARLDSESVRDEKVKVLKAISPIEEKNLVSGQFLGYGDESGVAKDSKTEAFAALRLEINSWRWKGVPFYIRAGKCLPVTAIEIVGKFRKQEAWRIVDPVLKAGTPIYQYQANTWGPNEVEQVTPIGRLEQSDQP